MHSSGMHTARLLTVSQYALCKGGGCVSQHALGRRAVYPSMHWAGGCTCPGSVPTQRVYLLRGGVPVQGGVLAQGGCLPREVCLAGGTCQGVCIPACNGADTPDVDRQTPVKT